MTRARDVANFIPPGGDTGQVLAKADGDDYSTIWSSGTPGGLPPITPGEDEGKALVVNDLGQAEWGHEIDHPDQAWDGGEEDT